MTGDKTIRAVTDLVLLVTETGHYQEFETGIVADLVMHHQNRSHLRMMLPETIVTQVMETVTAAMQKGSVHVANYALGTIPKKQYFEAKAIPLTTAYVLLQIQNVTVHEENKKALKRHNDLLQTVIDSVPPEITAFDNAGNITIINQAALRSDTTHGDQAESETINLKQDGKTEFKEDELPLVRAFRGETVYDQIVIKKREAHYPKTYLVNAIPLKDEQGGLNGVVLTERDITELKTVRGKLSAKAKDFDMFMYRASHDLKSPLAAMEGVLDFAFLKTSDPATRSYLEMIRKSHKQLSTLVNDLISLTRISQKQVEHTAICLHSLIVEVVGGIQLLPQAKDIIIKACGQTNATITADLGLVRAVLQNLICNAVLHHHPEGENRFVLIGILDQPKKVVLEVSDNGPGIAKGIQDKIYDMFYRGNMHVPGSGLGLFIVKQALEKLHATIELNSDELSGTTFSVFIPKN
jgi:signal transduction histidine kinase